MAVVLSLRSPRCVRGSNRVSVPDRRS